MGGEEFAGSSDGEDDEVGGVAFQEAARLLGEAEEPFGPEDLHPARGAAHGAGEEVDGGADADADGDARRVEVLGDPFFLLGTAEGSEEDVGLGLADAGAETFVIHLIERGKGRGVGASDFEVRVLAGDVANGLAEDIGAAAEEIDAPVLLFGAGQQAWDEVGAGDALGEGSAEEAGEPDEGRAIADDEVSLLEDAVEVGIRAGLDDEIDIGRGDVMGSAAGDHGINAVEGLGQGDAVEGDIEKADAGGGLAGGEALVSGGETGADATPGEAFAGGAEAVGGEVVAERRAGEAAKDLGGEVLRRVGEEDVRIVNEV